MIEIWKDVKGYEGYDQVSNMGRVKSLDRIIKDKNRNRFQKIKGKILKFSDNGKGYKLVFLTKNNKRQNKYVHRLVAENFLENLDDLPEVNHKDLNKNNNTILNLEWVSMLENKRHYQSTDFAKKVSIQKSITRKENYRNKIKDIIPKILYDYKIEEKTIEQINKETKIGNSMISRILKENNIKLEPNKRRKKLTFKRNKLGRFIKQQDFINREEEIEK